MFARFDENPVMTLEDIKETKRYRRTDRRTHAHTDNVKTVYPPQTSLRGYNQGAGNTENQDFELRNNGNTAIHFIGTRGWVPLGRPQYFLVCQDSVSPNNGHNLHLVDLF